MGTEQMGMGGNGNSPHGNPMGMGINKKWEWGGREWELNRWEWEGMGMLKAIPAHLYPRCNDDARKIQIFRGSTPSTPISTSLNITSLPHHPRCNDDARLFQDRRLTAADSASILSKHMDLLADSIAQFAVTGSAVRCMLLDQHDYELATALRLSDQQRDQRDALLSKLARTQDTLQVSRSLSFFLSLTLNRSPGVHLDPTQV